MALKTKCNICTDFYELFIKMIDDNKIQDVWEQGVIAQGFDPSQIRKDAAGAFIVRTHYKNRNSDYGWEIDYVFPESRGGDDNPVNLRPMQWENYVKKGDSFPYYETSVVAQDNMNVKKAGHYTVNSVLLEKLREIYHF